MPSGESGESGESRGENVRECDVCIVGAGLHARILARELAGPTARVVVIDCARDEGTGGDGSDLVDAFERPWVPLGPSHFDVAFALEGARWPVSHADLEPYFNRLRDRVDLPMSIHDERVFEELRIDPPVFDRAVVRSVFGHFPSGAPGRGHALLAPIEAGPHVEVVSASGSIHLGLRADGQAVDHVTLEPADRERSRAIVRAGCFVLAGDAVSNARQLLESRDVQPNGVGNDLDQVGRHATLRQTVLAAEVRGVHRPRCLPLHRRHETRRGFVVEPALHLSASRQADEDTRDVGLHFACLPGDWIERLPRQDDAQMGWLELPHVPVSPGTWRESLGVRLGLRHPGLVACVVDGPREQRLASLDVGTAADASPQTRFEQLSAHATRSIAVAADLLASELERLGIAQLTGGGRSMSTATRERDQPLDPVARTVHGGSEQLGSTTRMGATRREGVVDADCRVFGVRNLFIAGASVMPALAWSDPIHPVAALTLRLADCLREELAPRRAIP